MFYWSARLSCCLQKSIVAIHVNHSLANTLICSKYSSSNGEREREREREREKEREREAEEKNASFVVLDIKD